jgi:uncharacterized protein
MQNQFIRTHSKHIAATSAVLTLFVGGVAASADSKPVRSAVTTQSIGGNIPPRSIVVHGVGRVNATPDRVTIQIGVETSAPTAGQALKDNSTKATQLISTLKGRGIAEKDIQTSGLSINPQYDNTGRKIERYIVSNSVSVIVRDVNGAGPLIDAAASSAGDAIRVNSLQFGISETAAIVEQARVGAVADARKQAEQLAKAAGVKLGALRTIQSNSLATPQPIGLAEARKDTAAPIEAGTQEVFVDVDMAFDLAE